MMSTDLRQLLLASSVTLAILATMPAMPHPHSAQPLVDAARALVALDFCPGGGVLSCALQRG